MAKKLDEYRECLRRNLVTFMKDLRVDDDLLSHMVQARVYSEANSDDVMSKPTKQSKNAEFLDIVKTRGEHGFNVFIKALVTTNQLGLAERLNLHLANRYQVEIFGDVVQPQAIIPNRSETGNIIAHPASGMDNPGVSSTQEHSHQPDYRDNGDHGPYPAQETDSRTLKVHKCFEKDIPVELVRVAQQSDIVRRMRDTQSNDCYHISSSRKGLAVIINNINTDTGFRAGAVCDSDNLHLLLEQLNFIPIEDYNLTAEDLKSKVKGYADHHLLEETDVFVMCIMSHGSNGLILGTDGGEVNIEEHLLKPFHADVCPMLRNKPKVFLIQACQGDRITHGVPTIRPQHTATDCHTDVDVISEKGHQGSFQWREANETEKLHPEKDFLVAYSTCAGYVSFREMFGTWFIRAFIMEMHNNCHKEHMAEIMTRVVNAVSECRSFAENAQDDQLLQLPYHVSKLCKKLYLCAIDGE